MLDDDLGLIAAAFPYSSFNLDLARVKFMNELIERLVGPVTHTASKTGRIIRKPRIIEDVLKKRFDVLCLAVYPRGEEPNARVVNSIINCDLRDDIFTLVVRASAVSDLELLVPSVQILGSEVVYGYIRTGGITNDLLFGDYGVCKGMGVEEGRYSDANRWAIVIRKPPVRRLRAVYAINFFRERFFDVKGSYLEDWIREKGIGHLSQSEGTELLTWRCSESERVVATLELPELVMDEITKR